MRIVVVRVCEVAHFPPVQSLVSCLLDLGHSVTLLANEVEGMRDEVKRNENYSAVELGSRDTRFDRARQIVAVPKLVRKYIEAHRAAIDLIWTTTDISARVVGSAALGLPHVMQLSELVEYVPLFKLGESRLKSRMVPTMARRADVVVVPEYNRAHIQKVWWDLPEVPVVLPNKPYPDPFIHEMRPIPDLGELEFLKEKKVLLYQGVYDSDRDLTQYAEALNYLGDEFVLVLMGKPVNSSSDKMVRRTIDRSKRVFDLGFHPAPGHLAYTRLGYIGLMPYRPGKTNRFSSLNALYCAPNKIWEYSSMGLPVLSTDVPGVSLVVNERELGFTPKNDAASIAEAVKRIDSNYNYFSSNSSKYYQDLDYKQIVEGILNEAVREA